MTLSFSTKWKDGMGELAGKPTYFVEKIYKGLLERGVGMSLMLHAIAQDYEERFDEMIYSNEIEPIPKIHTIREDKHDRWKVGNKIHMVINNRTKDRFQFSPILQVKSIQKIKIENFGYYQDNLIFVDNRELNMTEMEQLARNDGFPNLESFFDFFNEDFCGKIIGWTDFKY